MSFIKGQKFSEEHKKKLKEARKRFLENGGKVWNKGLKTGRQSKEWRKKRGEAIKNHLPKTAFKKGDITWNKGKELPQFSGKNHYNWKGGLTKQQGYWCVYQLNHLKAWRKYVRQCVLVAEKYLGRLLEKQEIIHHINEIKDDDRPENLYLFPSQRKHLIFHHLKNKPVLISNII